MQWLLLVCAALLGMTGAIPSPPSEDPSDYGLTRSIPSGCVPDTDCMYFAGLRQNPGDSAYLDVYLASNAQGWVAIGFSDTPSMQNSDVLGCSVQSGTATVLPIDTFNVEGTRDNELDASGIGVESGQVQPDIMRGSGGFIDGRINCTFSRRIIGVDSDQDFDLDDDYHFLFGFGNVARDSDGLTNFPQHETTPTILGPFNPVRDMGALPNVFVSGSGTVPDVGLTTPTREPGDYRLRNRDPDGCDPDRCDYFMGIDTNEGNDSFLDFYLTADIGGWVAVGFSRSNNMLDADVLGCNVDGTQAFVVDTYNPSDPRTNRRDSDFSDIVEHSRSFEDGRISCNFSRYIEGGNSDEDKDLDRDYYFLFGVGGSGGGMGPFPDHGNRIPRISDGRFNPARDSGDIGIDTFQQQVLQAHGILMLIAWPLLAFTAIFFAAWMKQALPNGEWFLFHRIFHIAALVVAVVGFALAFVANKNDDGLIELGSDNKRGTTHFVLGIIIMALQIANPIIALFRCKPDGNYRWIFNLVHGTVIGLGVEFLAYINMAIGISIFSERESDFGDLTILWVYLAFVIFAVILNSVLLLVFTGEAILKREEGVKLAPAVVKPIFSIICGSSFSPEKVEMSQIGSTPSKPDGPPPRKSPAPDSPIRWIALGVFLGVMIPLIVAVIVMIAATGNLS